MFVTIEKYDGQPYKLRIQKKDAEALGFEHGETLEIPTHSIKVIEKRE